MCRIFEFSKYYVIFIYFQAAVSALLAVSVFYVEKNQNEYYVIFRKFFTYQIAFLMTCQRHKENLPNESLDKFLKEVVPQKMVLPILTLENTG